uniref:Innexin n=1 Tax=Culex pipiens TaxID=7175 RepID=A0A8D8E4P6_CULPI
MYKLLSGLKDYFKRQDIYTDSVIFRLHNSFTTALLLACSLVITATQFVGQPISCIVNGIPTHVVNTYCWISSTFTMPDAFRREVVPRFVQEENFDRIKMCRNVKVYHLEN